MTMKLKIVAILIGFSLFVYIIDLVRKRRLSEEYAWLWTVTGVAIIILSLWYDLLVAISNFLGGIVPSALLFFIGLLFMIIIILQMSVKISRLTTQVKNLAQDLAILKNEDENVR